MDSYFRTSSLAVIAVLLLAIVFGACDDDDGGDDSNNSSGEGTPSTGEDVPDDPTVAPGGQGGDTQGSDGGNSIQAVLDDFSIELAESTAPAGEVSFDIANGGDLTHDFIILQTELDPAELPQTPVAKVDLEQPDIAQIDAVTQIPSNERDTLTTSLAQGEYVIICNVAGHYDQGMYTTFTAE